MEIAFENETGLVHLRDSKDPSGPVLTFDRAAFQDYLTFVTEAGAAER